MWHNLTVPEPEITVPTGLTTEGLLGRRYAARVIDSVVILFLVGVGVVVAEIVPTINGLARGFSTLFVVLAIWIGYGTVLESSRWQATLGKRIVGLKAYNLQGGRMTLLQSAGRNAVKDGPFLLLGIIPGGQLLTLLWLAAHLVVLHRSPVYQAIHDCAAGTWVAAPEQTIQLRLA